MSIFEKNTITSGRFLNFLFNRELVVESKSTKIQFSQLSNSEITGSHTESFSHVTAAATQTPTTVSALLRSACFVLQHPH